MFFSDLVRCETRLYNTLNDRLRKGYGITASQYEFLRHLREHPHARARSPYIASAGESYSSLHRSFGRTGHRDPRVREN